MLKADASAAMNHIIARLGVFVILVAPCANLGCTVTHLRVDIGIKEPERYIDALYLVDMILILENLGQKLLSVEVLHQPRLCRLLIELERDHDVGLEQARELVHHDYRIAAERAGRCRRIGIAHYLSAAGFAYIRA